jgi:hypothetical protein
MARAIVIVAVGFLVSASWQGVPAQEEVADVTAETSWTQARQALNSGNSQMATAAFEAAEKSLREANSLAPPDSELKTEAEGALYLQLPSLVVHNLLSRGLVEEARLVLSRAINIAAGHPDYVQQLTAMEADLNKGNLLGVPIPVVEVDGRAVLGAVNEVLREHHRLLGRYPSSLSEISKLLPPGEPPLEQFFISSYATTGMGFQLELTNLGNREQVLRIDHTGLLR